MNLASIHNGEILKTFATEQVTMTEFLILLHFYLYVGNVDTTYKERYELNFDIFR